jgi:hypothetical protein
MSRRLAEVGADAYVWGFPLVTMRRTRAGHGPDGRMLIRDRLSTAADRTVVAPNNDTLYSSGWFDLAAGDVVVEVEPMDRDDRYWSVMLLDAYTNVSYVCRRLHGTAGAQVRVTYDPDAGPHPDPARRTVPIATPTLWVLARVLVDGPADLDAARAAQAGIAVGQPAPRAAAGEPPAVAGGGAPAGFVDALRAALAVDPPAPWHPAPPPGLRDLLAAPPPDPVVATGVEQGEARIAEQGRGPDRTGNGWGTRSRGAAFGDDVAYRAAFARYSLAGHLPAENRSYSRVIDGSRASVLALPPGGEPPVDGFWSLSLYGPDMFFVANELDRYSIGDRTPGVRREPDGSLRIVIGHDRPRDAANWLPAPAGPCVLALRAYEGRPAVTGATWFPPDLVPLES